MISHYNNFQGNILNNVVAFSFTYIVHNGISTISQKCSNLKIHVNTTTHTLVVRILLFRLDALQLHCTLKYYNQRHRYTCTHCSVAHVARVTGAVEASDSVITLGILVTIIIHIQHTLVYVCIIMHGARENTFKYSSIYYSIGCIKSLSERTLGCM